MLNGKRIREVTAQGVRYVDENNVEQFIDFVQCYQNYVKERLSPDTREHTMEINQMTDADWDKHVERVKKFKEIGVRQVLTPPWADGPFIEFYTEPRMRFKFDSREEYAAVREAIYDTEYKLFDQS